MAVTDLRKMNPFLAYKLWHKRLMQLRKGATIPGCDEEYIRDELDKLYSMLEEPERVKLTALKEEEAAE